jgi:DNA repair exonuclease SbcCD ATPase subunit
MEKDLRNLFDTEEFPKKKLPVGHEENFMQKLNQQQPAKKNSRSFFLKVAASIAIIFTVGYFVINSTEIDSQTELQKQVAQIEKNYLKQIDQEWKTFEETAKDPNLIKYYKERLDRLKEDYDQISKRFSEDPNNILILEELIKNLQRRLELLKNIQKQIEANKQNKRYETIII